MSLYWLSFADDTLPKGKQFLGVTIVDGVSFVDAVTNAHNLDCNPGGQVLGSAIPTTITVAPEYMNRLLTKEEAVHVDGLFKKQLLN